MLLIIIISISLYFITRWLEFQKVYSSYEDKKLALSIEKTLEKSAKIVKENKKSISINLYELTKNKEFDKICIVGPYNPDINQFLGVDWEQSKIWTSRIVNYDSLFSMFLINKYSVIPIRVNRKDIINYDIKTPCVKSTHNLNLEFIENNSNVYLKIIN